MNGVLRSKIVEFLHSRFIMSGRHFDYRKFAMSDIANTIERDT